MKPTDDLFHLIRSMTKGEKRSFRLHSNRYKDGDQKYLLLFQTVHDQHAYDETEVKMKVAKEIAEGSFSSAKNYLWNLLNDFLLLHHAEETNEGKCLRSLEKAVMLKRRGLTSAAKKEVRSARKIAEKYELLDSLLRVNEVERNLLKRYQKKGINKSMEALLKEHEELVFKIELETEQVLVYDRLSIFMRSKFSLQDPDLLKLVREIQTMPALQPGHKLDSFRAQRLFHLSRTFCFHILGDSKGEFSEYQELLTLWSKNPHQEKEQYVFFRMFLCNFLHSAARNRRLDLFPKLLDRLGQLPVENDDDEVEDFTVRQFYLQFYALNKRNLEEAVRLAEQFPVQLERFGNKVTDSGKLGMQLNLLFTHFLNGNFKQANKWATQVKDNPSTQHRLDLQALARVFEVVTLYEMKEFEYLISLAKANGEWLRSHKLSGEFERLVINALSRMASHQDGSWRVDLGKLYEQLKGLENGIQGLEEMLYWAKSLLLGVSISDVFLGKVDLG